MKEIQYIDKIDVLLDNDNLIVNFSANDKFNKKAMEDYYFTPKVFNAIYKMGNFINVNGIVKLNNNLWELKK